MGEMKSIIKMVYEIIIKTPESFFISVTRKNWQMSIKVAQK